MKSYRKCNKGIIPALWLGNRIVSVNSLSATEMCLVTWPFRKQQKTDGHLYIVDIRRFMEVIDVTSQDIQECWNVYKRTLWILKTKNGGTVLNVQPSAKVCVRQFPVGGMYDKMKRSGKLRRRATSSWGRILFSELLGGWRQISDDTRMHYYLHYIQKERFRGCRLFFLFLTHFSMNILGCANFCTRLHVTDLPAVEIAQLRMS